MTPSPGLEILWIWVGMLTSMKNRQSDTGMVPCCPYTSVSKHPRRGEVIEMVSGGKILRYFIIGCVLALIADIPSSFGTAYLAGKVVLYVLLFASLLLPIRRGLIFLLLIAIVSQDIIQTSTESAEFGSFLMASIWQGRLGPLRPSWIVMAFCLVLLVKSRLYFRNRAVLYAVLWFSTVPLITGFCYSGISTSVSLKEMIIDVKLPLFLLVSILLFSSYLKRHPRDLAKFAAVFIGSILARHLIDFAYWLLGKGAVFDEAVRVSLDSTKGTVVFLLLFAMILVMLQKRFFVGGILGIISGLLLVVYTARGLWVSSLIGVAIFFLMMRVSKWVLALPIVAILAYGSLMTLSVMSPKNIELLKKRTDAQVLYDTKNLMERYFPNRYIELLNATDTTIQRNAVLWGNGYGSYYTESVMPFAVGIKNAFPDYSIESGRFYKLHHFILRMLFEHGLVGLLIISSLWLVPGWYCFRAFRNPEPSLFNVFMVAIVAFLPTSMLEISWTGKGMIICGFVIAFCMSAYKQSRNSIRDTRDCSPSKSDLSRTDVSTPQTPVDCIAEETL